MKNNNLMTLLIGMAVLCGLYNQTAQGKIATPTQRILAKPAVPSTNKTYTVQQLLNLINSNNPNQTSTFLVAANGTSVVLDKDAWAVDQSGKITNLTGSKSTDLASLKSLIQSNLNASVTLKADPVLIKSLVVNGVLDSTTQGQYSKILLYFTLGGYRFYLNDPNPGRIVRSAGVLRSPALNIISKWDFTKSF